MTNPTFTAPILLAERPYLGRRQILDLFRPFSGYLNSVLLDSAGHAHSTFDLCSAFPEQTFSSPNGAPPIFPALHDLLPSCNKSGDSSSLSPPFAGGLIWALSYDVARQLEQLPMYAEQDIDLPSAYAGLYHWAIIVDHQRQHTGLWQFGPLSQTTTGALLSFFNTDTPAKPDFQLNNPWQSNFSRASYGTAFRKVQAYIRAGDCYQINLAQRFTAGFSGHPYSAYEQLSALNGAPFSAYFNLGQHHILSFSPERFIRVNQQQAITEPIKGTRPRSSMASDDNQLKQELIDSEKDRAENVMIVDLLRNDFSRCCVPGTVKVPELFAIHSYPAVHHLVSRIEGRLHDEKSALDLLEACFPGGSITGAPKVRAMEIIEELEPHRRSMYCGSIGYVDYAGRMDSSITIRTLVCDKQNIHCWAGGGLVADSDEQTEYDETLHKVSRLLPNIAALRKSSC